MSKIKLKAKKDAPEFVQVGNLSAENKDGYFYAETRDFADALIADGYAAEIVKSPPAAPKAAKPKKTASEKPAAAPAQATAAPPTQTEKSNEGETK